MSKSSFSNFNIEEFQKYLDERIKKGVQSGTNLILTGTVEKIFPDGYDIKIENNGAYSVVSATTLTKDSYVKDDFVFLIKSSVISGGESVYRYFILGRVEDDDFQTFVNYSSKFRPVGDTKRETSIELDFLTENQLVFEIKEGSALFKDVLLLGYMQLSALFNVEDNDKVDYGFLIEYYNKDNEILSSQRMGVEFFVGDLYFQDSYPQSGVIAIPEEIKTATEENKQVSIIRISLFVDRDNLKSKNSFSAYNIAVAAGSYEQPDVSRFKVVVAADNTGKDYFRGLNSEEKIEDAISLIATVFFDSQELLSEDVDFYWEVKEDEEWKLLNGIQSIITAKENSDSFSYLKEPKSKSISTLKISETDENYKYFLNYLTKVRCRTKYKNIEVVSEEFDVINYERGDYSLSFLLNSGSSILLKTEDTVELKAKIINNNSFIKEDNLNINWKWKVYSIGADGVIGTQNLGDSLVYDTIIIKNDGKTSISSREIEIPDDAVGVQGAVAAQLLDENGDVYLTLESDPNMPIVIRTEVSSNTEIRAETIYKYCLASNMSLVFEEDNSDIGWKPVDYTEYIEWKELKERNEDGLQKLNSMSIGANKYLYYTQATSWEKYNKYEYLGNVKTDPWTRPTLLRYVNLAGENVTGAAIEQINTFNQLTNNGKEQGIFYDESKEDGKKLYINATFIQTGTLRVGDNTDERFYASLNDSVVRIGGWGVGANELISKNQLVGLSSDAEGSNVVIWAGGEKDNAPFKVTADGTVSATDFVQMNLLEEEVSKIDSSVSEINTDINGLKTGVNWFTYKDADNDGEEDTIIINAGKHLYLGSGSGLETGEGQLTIMTEHFKLFKLKNNEYGLVIDTSNFKLNKYNESGEFVETELEVVGKIKATSLEIESGAIVNGLTTSTELEEVKNTVTSAQTVADAAAAGAKLNGNYINTYFKVENNYIKMASNTLWLESNLLVINTLHLLLNHNGTEYQKGAFAVNTDNFTLDEKGNVRASSLNLENGNSVITLEDSGLIFNYSNEEKNNQQYKLTPRSYCFGTGDYGMNNKISLKYQHLYSGPFDFLTTYVSGINYEYYSATKLKSYNYGFQLLSYANQNKDSTFPPAADSSLTIDIIPVTLNGSTYFAAGVETNADNFTIGYNDITDNVERASIYFTNKKQIFIEKGFWVNERRKLIPLIYNIDIIPSMLNLSAVPDDYMFMINPGGVYYKSKNDSTYTKIDNSKGHEFSNILSVSTQILMGDPQTDDQDAAEFGGGHFGYKIFNDGITNYTGPVIILSSNWIHGALNYGVTVTIFGQ